MSFCNPHHEWQEIGNYFICKACGMIKEKPKNMYPQPQIYHPNPYQPRWQNPAVPINQAFHGIPTQY